MATGVMSVAQGKSLGNAIINKVKNKGYTTNTGDVAGPQSSTDGHVVVFDGSSGKAIKDGTYTIGKSVPADAVFTDTTYSLVGAQNSTGLVKNGSSVSSADGLTACPIINGVPYYGGGGGGDNGLSVVNGELNITYTTT